MKRNTNSNTNNTNTIVRSIRRTNSSTAQNKRVQIDDDEFDIIVEERLKQMVDDKFTVICDTVKQQSLMTSQRVNDIMDEKLRGIQETLKTTSSPVNGVAYDSLVDKMNNIAFNMNMAVKDAITSQQKDYAKQYSILESKYQRLKETNEKQFFRFNNLITGYQQLIFKMYTNHQTTISASHDSFNEEFKIINELTRNVNIPPPESRRPTVSNICIPQPPLHTTRTNVTEEY